jgi:hypothetical protein
MTISFDHTVHLLTLLQNHVRSRSVSKTITKMYEPHSLATVSDLHYLRHLFEQTITRGYEDGGSH